MTAAVTPARLAKVQQHIRNGISAHNLSVRGTTIESMRLGYADGVLHYYAREADGNKYLLKSSYDDAKYSKYILATYYHPLYAVSMDEFIAAFQSFRDDKIIGIQNGAYDC